jgi:excisionase family DNA binding protein
LGASPTNIPSPVLDDALLTVSEVANLLNVPVSWVYEHTRKKCINRIPGFRLGKYWRFRDDDILQWLERQRISVLQSDSSSEDQL